MDRAKVMASRARVKEVLAELGNELGVTFEIGRATFDDLNATFTLNMTDYQNGEEITKMEADFISHCTRYGLSTGDFGKEVKIKTRTNGEIKTTKYKIVGLKPRNRRYPIIVESTTGNSYKFPAAAILNALGK